MVIEDKNSICRIQKEFLNGAKLFKQQKCSEEQHRNIMSLAQFL
ncbi:hypothetical protein Pan161_46210 [Gimesia algae]|uniref:Uncharacterized protein n=1 Tax=Gimesia algae TaxID=2527971 RepID=A0A517VIX5_9PLAN|nr:hypothetical protein Pan161_46210 [Gimesia algae]